MSRIFRIRKFDFFPISFFLYFALWTPDFLMFDMKIGFLIKNCVYRQLEMSRIQNFDGNQPNTLGGGIVFVPSMVRPQKSNDWKSLKSQMLMKNNPKP